MFPLLYRLMGPASPPVCMPPSQTSDKNFMYLLFAAEPYETISFKVPNAEVDKSEGKIFTHW